MEYSDTIRDARKTNVRLDLFIQSSDAMDFEWFKQHIYSQWIGKVMRWSYEHGKFSASVDAFTAGDLVIINHDLFNKACKYIVNEGISFKLAG